MPTQILTSLHGRKFGLDSEGNLIVNDKRGINHKLTAFEAANTGAKNGSTVAVQETGNGVVHQTSFTFTATPITMADSTQGGGVKIYDFPAGRILILGASGSIAVTTTSTLASTLNTGVTCNWGIGSVVQASATLATTEQNFLNVTAFTASATINVAGAAAPGVGIAVLTPLNGTVTPVDAYLNLAVAGATDIDGDATVTVTGTATLTWMLLGTS
jgi:hypothetical protein